MMNKIKKIIFFIFILASQPLYSQTQLSADKLKVISSNPDLVVKYENDLKSFPLANFNQSLLDQLIHSLHSDINISNVKIVLNDSDKNKILEIHITPKPFVSRVSISGNKFYKNDELLRDLKISHGKLAETIKIDELETILERKYYADGFFDINAEIKLIEISDNGGTLLSIVIFEGNRFKLLNLRFLGLRDIDSEILENKMNLSVGKFIKFKNILRGISNIEEYLIRMGFPKAQVNLPIIEKINDFAILTIFISQGKKISFKFTQDKIKRDSKLLNVLKSDGNIPRPESDRLIEFYKSKGYHFVKIDKIKELKNDFEEMYTFKINKGSKIKIDGIEFNGNASFDNKTLFNLVYKSLKSIKFHKLFYEKAVTYATSAITEFYKKNGYSLCEVSVKEISIVNNRARIMIDIKENTIIKIGGLTFWGNKEFASDDLLFDLAVGTPFFDETTSEVRRKILKKYLTHGFIDCKVDYKSEIDEKKNEAKIHFSIIEGEKALVGSIDIRGNNRTYDYLIRERISIKIGEPLNPDEIFNTERAIQKTGLFDRVSILDEGKIENTNQHKIIIDVKEKKGMAVELGFGFASESPNNPFYFEDNIIRWHASFKHNNLGGKGESLFARTQLSPHISEYSDGSHILEWRANIGYKEPDVLNTTLDFTVYYLNLRETRISYDLDENSFEANIEKNFENLFKVSSGYTFEFSKTFNKLDEEDRLLRLGSVGLMFNKNIQRKRNIFSGLFSNLNLNLYTKRLLSEEDFYKIFMRNDVSFSLFNDIIGLLLSLRGGFSDVYSSTLQIPIEKRIFLGGTGSVRGFPKDYVGTSATFIDNKPIGGNIALNYILEVTFPIYKDLKFAIFSDGGNVYANKDDFDILNERNSLGFGIHYNTPIGPVKLDYGFIMDRKADEGIGGFHFSIGIL